MSKKTLINTELQDLKTLSDGNWIFTSYRGWSQSRSSTDVECIFRRLIAIPSERDKSTFLDPRLLSNQHRIVNIHLGTLPRLQPLSVWRGQELVLNKVGGMINGTIDFSQCKIGPMSEILPSVYSNYSQSYKDLLLDSKFILAPIQTGTDIKFAVINCTEIFRRFWGFSSALAKAFVRTSVKESFSHIFHVIDNTDDILTIKRNRNMNSSDENFIGLLALNTEAQDNIKKFSKTYHASINKEYNLAFPECNAFNATQYRISAHALTLKNNTFNNGTVFINRLTSATPVYPYTQDKKVVFLTKGVDRTGEDKEPTSFPPSDPKQKAKQDKKSKFKKNIDDNKHGSNKKASISIEIEPSIYTHFRLDHSYFAPESKYKNDGSNGIKPPFNHNPNLSTRSAHGDTSTQKAGFEASDQNSEIPVATTDRIISLDVFDSIVDKAISQVVSAKLQTTTHKIYATTNTKYHITQETLSTFVLHFTRKTGKLMNWYYNSKLHLDYFFNPNTPAGNEINQLNELSEPKQSIQRKLAVYELNNVYGTVYIYKIEPFVYSSTSFSYAIIHKPDLSKLTSEEFNYIFKRISEHRSLQIRGNGNSFLVKNVKHHFDANLEDCLDKNVKHLVESLPKIFVSNMHFQLPQSTDSSGFNNTIKEPITNSISTT